MQTKRSFMTINKIKKKELTENIRYKIDFSSWFFLSNSITFWYNKCMIFIQRIIQYISKHVKEN